MRLVHFAVLSTLAFSALSLAQGPPPVNTHASPEARALLGMIDSISGKGIVTGQHNFPNDGSKWTDRAYDLTGKYPGLFGEDFGFSGGEDKDSTLSRPAMIEEVKRQYKNGAIIALTWHSVRPTDDEPVTFHDSVQGKLTDYEWHELLTPGTPLYKRWCEQVDVIAGYLRQLRDAHVPVLFRPYHEVNGNWFWWGYRPGKDGSAALYRQLYDRFVNVHHLDNLVWVWNVNAPGGAAGPIADYYPGADYADVVTMDIYGQFKQEYYDSMLALAAGKPIALAEVGGLPSPQVLAEQPRWAYFMVWSGLLETSPNDLMQAVYHDPHAVNRDDARLANPMQAAHEASAELLMTPGGTDPVTADATEAARQLLSRLSSSRGAAVVSGQQIEDISQPASTAGPQPVLSSIVLETNPTDAWVKQAAALAGRERAIAITWRPARPTGGAPAKSQLTDYEWADLLTPGSDLNKLWAAQVDETARILRSLGDAGIAVLWNPYPEPNGKDFWWAGRKGIHGSAALYRMLFDRLVQQDHVGNLVWVWESGPPSFGPSSAGSPSEFFPGLLYTDALEMRVPSLNPRFPIDRFLSQTAVGKPIGIELTGDVPSPDALTSRSAWSWFILDPPSDSQARSEALRQLYADPRIASRAAAH